METFDLLILGAGPGGYETAAVAAARGLKVALVERDYLGGTCLNRGCIPTKTLCHGADLVAQAKKAASYGIDFGETKVDYKALVEKKNSVVAQLRSGIEMLLGKVEIVRGTGRFIAPKTVEVDGRQLTAERIIIATGSAPASLNIPGKELAVNSDQLLEMTELPGRIAIIGGGVIGMEFASIFNKLGAEVTVVEYCKEILPPFDKDIAKRLRMALAGEGITFYTAAEVTAIQEGYKVVFSAKGKEQSVEADLVVMAVGRRASMPEGLDVAGVNTYRRGIEVDPNTMATSADGVYAIGDVNGLCMLAHAASAQGRVVLGEDVNLSVIPSAVFTTPEAAMVGLTEEQCKEKGLNYKAIKTLFRSNGKAVSMDETGGMIKMIVDTDSRRILGCHILGPHAADIIHQASIVMANNQPVDNFSHAVFAHPTLSEALAQAALSF
jgi:dihydrolipoamide dehydrogenase